MPMDHLSPWAKQFYLIPLVIIIDNNSTTRIQKICETISRLSTSIITYHSYSCRYSESETPPIIDIELMHQHPIISGKDCSILCSIPTTYYPISAYFNHFNLSNMERRKGNYDQLLQSYYLTNRIFGRKFYVRKFNNL